MGKPRLLRFLKKLQAGLGIVNEIGREAGWSPGAPAAGIPGRLVSPGLESIMMVALTAGVGIWLYNRRTKST